MEIKSITKCRKPLGEKMPKFQLCDAGMNMQQFSGNRPNYHLTCVIQFICLLLYANMFSCIRLLLYICQYVFSYKDGNIKRTMCDQPYRLSYVVCSHIFAKQCRRVVLLQSWQTSGSFRKMTLFDAFTQGFPP